MMKLSDIYELNALQEKSVTLQIYIKCETQAIIVSQVIKYKGT